MDHVVNQVRNIVAVVTRVPVSDLSSDTDLFDTGILDSMQALQVINDIERHFNVAIPDDEVGGYTTIRLIARGVSRHIDSAN